MSKKMELEIVSTGQYRGNHWEMLKDRGWGVGTKLRAVEPDKGKGGGYQTTRIHHLTALDNNRLNSEGKYDVQTDSPLFGKSGTGAGIITFCEWPIGGPVTAVSLNCRDWEKIK